MRALTTISRFRRLWVEPFPGFWLNCLGLAASLALVTSASLSEAERIDRRTLAALEVSKHCLSSKVTGSLTLNAAADHLRINLLDLMFDNTEDAILAHTGLEPRLQEEYTAASEYLDSMHLRHRLALVEASSAERTAENLSQQLRTYLVQRSILIQNRPVHALWATSASIYILIVALAYFRNRLDPRRGEPVLNIIDLGLYLTLVEYSGALASPVLLLLSFSLMTTGLDFIRVSKQSGGVSFAKIRLFGWRRVLGRYAPTILYVFTLVTGLVWASLDSALSLGLAPWAYFRLYCSSLARLTMLGSLALLTITLVARLIRQQERDSPFYLT